MAAALHCLTWTALFILLLWALFQNCSFKWISFFVPLMISLGQCVANIQIFQYIRYYWRIYSFVQIFVDFSKANIFEHSFKIFFSSWIYSDIHSNKYNSLKPLNQIKKFIQILGNMTFQGLMLNTPVHIFYLIFTILAWALVQSQAHNVNKPYPSVQYGLAGIKARKIP